MKLRTPNIVFLVLLLISFSSFSAEHTRFHVDLTVKVAIDTPQYNFDRMDSLYRDPNANEFKVKLVFPFIWAADFNGNNLLEFSEFQQVHPFYYNDDRVAIAVNYELIDSLSANMTLHVKLLSYHDGALIYHMKQKILSPKKSNNLSYFFLNSLDYALNDTAKIEMIDKPSSDSIPTGLFVYQAYLEHDSTKKKWGGAYDSLLIIEYIDTTKPPKKVVMIDTLETKKDLKLFKKMSKDSIKSIIKLAKTDAKAAKKEAKALMKDIKSKYKSYKKAIKKGEAIYQSGLELVHSADSLKLKELLK